MAQAHRRFAHLVGGEEHHAALLEDVLQSAEVRGMHATLAEFKTSDGVGGEPRRRPEVAQAEA